MCMRLLQVVECHGILRILYGLTNGIRRTNLSCARTHKFFHNISSKSVQLLQTAFLHIDVTSTSVNPISGGTSCTYVNHSLHSSFRQTNDIQPVPFKGPDSVVDS